MDQPPSPHPLVVGLPRSCELALHVGAVLSVEGSEVTPLPVDFFGSCTTCWYSIGSHPGSGWQRGGTIWGACSTNVGCVRAHWARPLGPCAIWDRAFLSAVPLIIRDLPMSGRPCGAVGNPPDGGASGGRSLQLEKSGGVRLSGGATYPDIPATVVLGVVMQSLHTLVSAPLSGSTTGGESAGRLPCMCTGSLGGNSNSKILILSTFLAAGVGPQLEGPYHGPDWVAVPADLLQCLVPRQPNQTNSAQRGPSGSLPAEAPSQVEEV